MTAQPVSTDVTTRAQQLLRDAIAAPADALQQATELARTAQRLRQWDALSTVLHAEGIAAKELDQLPRSAKALRRSVFYAKRAESGDLERAARMALGGTLTLQGRMAAAATELALAAQLSTGVEAAKARVQQSALLLYLGRWDDGFAALRPAVATLRRADEPEWTVRALLNRSLIFTRRRMFAQAAGDLAASAQLVERHGLTAWGSYVQQNWGWMEASRGHVMDALDHYQQAEQINRRLGTEVGGLAAARARLLLSLRMLTEARDAAETAVHLLHHQLRDPELLDSQLLLSTVALVQRDAATAARAADVAIRGFRRLGQQAGLALARHAKLQARMEQRPESVTSRAAREVADELAAAGWTIPALDARVLAGRLALTRGRTDEARHHLEQAARARTTGPAEIRTRAWLAEALLREAESRPTAARSAIATGLRIVEDYQASLGATELRAHVTSHREDLAAAGLRMALADGDARRLLSFVERGRASSLRLRRPDRREDPELTARLAELRSVVADLEEARAAGRPVTGLTNRQVHLERQVAERVRQLPPATGTATGRTFGELVESLRDAALVEFVQQAGQLHAVTVVDGRPRLHSLGEVATMEARTGHLAFAVRRLADPATLRLSREAAAAVLARITGEWDELLFAPLRRALGDRPLVLVPSDSVHGVPWAMLPSCTGRPLTVVPSARLWVTATDVATEPNNGGTIVVAGPGLPGAETEAADVAAGYPGATVLTGADATTRAVLQRLDGAALLHVAAHGRLRSDNPFFSALLLADGPLTIYELERLGRAPRHVVLAACEAATQRVLAVDEVTGLSTALLAQGTASLIAPVMEVADGTTGSVMLDYHAQLRAGRTPAQALAAAVERARTSGSDHFAAAGVFVCTGAGHRPLS